MANSKVLDLSRCNTSFGLDLFKKLAVDKKEENIFFSPFSISCALAMTSVGARNETLQQLRKALRIDAIQEQEIHKIFLELHDSILQDASKGCTMHLANRLYGEKSYKFKSDFLQDCMKYYSAGLADVDFRNNAPVCEKEINGWISKETENRIKDLIPSGTLNSETKLVLVNAIYFKGDWKYKFNAHMTSEGDFHMNPNHSAKLQMMEMMETHLNYGVNDKLQCQVLELPYEESSVSMFILLPDIKKTTLEELENSLSLKDLHEIIVERQLVNVWLPRFNAEQDFELSDILIRLGAANAFAVGKSDFSGMVDSAGISLSMIIHNAFVNVNEQGMEAAAATAVILKECCLVFSQTPVDFRADHPFIYFLKDNATKSILFFGRFTKP